MTERRVYAEKLAEEQRAAQDLGALQAQITEKEAQVCGLCNDDSFLCSRQGAQCLGAIVYAKQPSQHTQITTCTHAHTHASLSHTGAHCTGARDCTQSRCAAGRPSSAAAAGFNASAVRFYCQMLRPVPAGASRSSLSEPVRTCPGLAAAVPWGRRRTDF